MRGPDASTLGRLLQQYFVQHLKVERRVSDNTIASYASTFRLLIAFCLRRRKRRALSLEISDLDAPTILTFLRHLEAERGSGPLTRNARLAAVKSFFRYVAVHDVQALPIAQRVLAIPTKRFDKKLVGYLTQEEMKAVLVATDPSTWSGRRDHAMLMTAYDTAARVSELVGMRRADADLAPKLGIVKIHGKGRKERVVVLSPQTTAVLRRWDRDLGDGPAVLFPNRAGGAMTRSGAHARLREAVKRAAATCSSLVGRKVSPHTIRHTTAMHLLQSGMNLAAIALFLGHEDVQTTHGYVEADAELKRRTLAALPRLGRGRRTSSKQRDELIAFLESLQREHRL
ncbi:tyrosine-type recombinase/integrase [Anaeromyxobacter soli]|uniref:tyrosine-type recombinase/integrase n=1 Tax=Anaeromyxobacter soli TaxID=2922725 RepID=UPI001FAFE357|nr:tyrosine-type recombinase/integrase [Anaeromyxobacter sp. SG29]